MRLVIGIALAGCMPVGFGIFSVVKLSEQTLRQGFSLASLVDLLVAAGMFFLAVLVFRQIRNMVREGTVPHLVATHPVIVISSRARETVRVAQPPKHCRPWRERTWVRCLGLFLLMVVMASLNSDVKTEERGSPLSRNEYEALPKVTVRTDRPPERHRDPNQDWKPFGISLNHRSPAAPLEIPAQLERRVAEPIKASVSRLEILDQILSQMRSGTIHQTDPQGVKPEKQAQSKPASAIRTAEYWAATIVELDQLEANPLPAEQETIREFIDRSTSLEWLKPIQQAADQSDGVDPDLVTMVKAQLAFIEDTYASMNKDLKELVGEHLDEPATVLTAEIEKFWSSVEEEPGEGLEKLIRYSQKLTEDIQDPTTKAWSEKCIELLKQDSQHQQDTVALCVTLRRKYPGAVFILPSKASLHRDRAMQYWDAGEVYRAIRELNEALRWHPRDARLWHVRGEFWRELGEPDIALEDFDQAIKLDPEMPIAYRDRGYLFWELDEPDQALRDLNRAIVLDPEDYEALNYRAQLALGQGRHEDVIADCNRAIKLVPDNVSGYLMRGMAYEHQQVYVRALMDYSQAIQCGTNPLAFKYRALLLATCPSADLRDGKQAVQDATKGCELTGWIEPTHLGTLAAAYAECGDFESAAKYAVDAIEAAGDDWEGIAAYLRPIARKEPIRMVPEPDPE